MGFGEITSLESFHNGDIRPFTVFKREFILPGRKVRVLVSGS